ncbi:type VI secretion system baseplate subunit TssK [Tropicimonas sp. S265A]|uniref:type VI secretion system baseplate subunit TssK n=1 Tax=Tropicimonas sp. S265A TaxID=3415134 RepID=UPI003C7ECAE2
MSWDSKVVWSEGLFIQPHHFQQSDRYHEALVGGLARRASPYLWGVSQLEIDNEMLKLGKFALRSAAGLTPDGALFRVPLAEPHPPALEVPDTVRDAIVYLTVPARRAGGEEVDLSPQDSPVARYRAAESEVIDSMGKTRRTVNLAVGQLRLGFALDVDDLSDLLVIPIARIIEVRADKEIVLDTGFMPSCTDIRAATPLSGFVREVEGMLGIRATAIAGRFVEAGTAQGVAEISDFLLLMLINRTLPAFRHMMNIENVHPITVYQSCVSLAGELATFMSAEKLPPEFPPYKHDNLTETFRPVMRVLREYLSAVLEQTAVAIPLDPRKYGVSVGVIADRKLLRGSQFVLAVSADAPAETLRRHFPTQAKIGPVEEIRQLVNSALPGIDLSILPVAPRQIPYHAGKSYFELDSNSKYWSQITTSGGIAVHVSGDFPGLTMELWAIRQG